MVDTFVTQMDGCNYMVDGRPSQGKNCTCACHAMWLFRASQGKIRLSSCACRMKTGDRIGGTHLGQMEQISLAFGITGGRVFRPIAAGTALNLLETGRYGTHWQGDYSPFIGTKYDTFGGRFADGHDFYVSGMGTDPKTLRVADPGRKFGYQNIPIDLMLRSAARLEVGDGPLGTGKVYAYFTPPDPLPVVQNHHKARVIKETKLWNDQQGYWVWVQKIGTVLEVRGKGYPKGGVLCYPVTNGPCSAAAGTSNRAGYYVAVSTVRLEGQCT